MLAAIYCRLSEEDKNKQFADDDSESIQNQKSMLIEYALERQWEIYNIYSDDDYAGADRGRPAFNQLLKDAEHHRFHIVLCKTQSRFTRELELVEKYIHGLFPRWGIRFISIVDNADTEIKGNKKSRQINGLVNEWYLEDMSDNIKSVLTSKRKNGFHIGSFAPYGYLKDPTKKGHLIIDKKAAAIVQEIFILYMKGYGKTAIAQHLNERGIPNPTEYKRLNGLPCKSPKGKYSNLWRYSTISSILHNESYIGNMVQGKYGSISYKTKENRPRPKNQWIRAENTHAPIIDQDLWDTVQRMLRQHTKPYKSGSIGIFSKKTKCKYCGYTMRSSKNHGRHYLKCPVKHAAKDACIGGFISVDALEKAVIHELQVILNTYLDEAACKQQIHCIDTLEAQMDKLQAELSYCAKKEKEYGRAIQALYLDKTKGIVSEAEFTAFSKNFYNEKKHFSRLADNTKKALEKLLQKSTAQDYQQNLLDKYRNIDSLNRETIEKLINYITIGRREENTNRIPIEIYWNF